MAEPPSGPVDLIHQAQTDAIKRTKALLSGASAPVPTPNFVCGPDVTNEVATVWAQIQQDFRTKWSFNDKKRACDLLFLPIKKPDDPVQVPKTLEELMQQARAFAEIDGFDVFPLFQGSSGWLRLPPVYDRATNGPCATPSSSDFDNPDMFSDGHEDPATCSNTVAVAGQCWLNGTVNYGTFGIMVRLCSDFAASDPAFSPIWHPVEAVRARTLYSLRWATTLIKAYKKFGNHPEAAKDPIRWTEATFNSGPKGVPSGVGNRPKCGCTCGCKGDIVDWDYRWKPVKVTAVMPVAKTP